MASSDRFLASLLVGKVNKIIIINTADLNSYNIRLMECHLGETRCCSKSDEETILLYGQLESVGGGCWLMAPPNFRFAFTWSY